MKKKVTIVVIALFCLLFPNSTANAMEKDSAVSLHGVESQSAIEPRNAAVNYYRFFKNGESIDYKGGTPKVVSSDLTGPGTISIIFSRTFTSSFSTSLAANNSSLIKATAVASCSTSTTNSVEYTCEIEKGKTGHVMFRPYRVYVQGSLKYYSSLYPSTPISTSQVSAWYVKKLNGFAHGHFYPLYI